jgi:xanthine dehydrogenase accessory factor
VDRATLSALLEACSAHEPVVLATRVDTGEQRLLRPLTGESAPGWPDAAARTALVTDRARVESTEAGEVFLRPYNPPVRVLIVGAVHVSQALVPQVQAAGFEPIVIDPRDAFATEGRFPGVRLVRAWPEEALEELRPDHRTALVVLTHDPKFDDPALVAGLRTDAFYVGALGSRRTHAKRLERLAREGVDPESLERIRAPIGLDIGARTPGEIGVSILAEIIAALRSGDGH